MSQVEEKKEEEKDQIWKRGSWWLTNYVDHNFVWCGSPFLLCHMWPRKIARTGKANPEYQDRNWSPVEIVWLPLVTRWPYIVSPVFDISPWYFSDLAGLIRYIMILILSPVILSFLKITDQGIIVIFETAACMQLCKPYQLGGRRRNFTIKVFWWNISVKVAVAREGKPIIEF